MKKLLEISVVAYVLGISLYAIWKYRYEIWQVYEEIDDELLTRAQYYEAVQATLRSIKRLPETPEGGEL